MNKPELQNRYQLFIGGQWSDASDGEFFTTKCPANGEKLAECAQAAKEDVDDAVREAWKAFETWKK
ncbi:aldehyde dehydrogenase family protein, partial [Clostridioides difficile]|nr:aldehyde dehydrogenase family protein [Clostridioides difficile]